MKNKENVKRKMMDLTAGSLWMSPWGFQDEEITRNTVVAQSGYSDTRMVRFWAVSKLLTSA